MALSVATLWLGPSDHSTYSASGYSFAPVPQVGQRDDMARAGESKMAPTNKRRLVTLHGHLSGSNLHDIQTKIAALRTALSKEGQVLYFHDGASIQINNMLVTVDNVDIPVQWGQYHTDYTINLSYWPLDDVHSAPAVVSYGTYVFCDMGANIGKPIPVIGREEKVERQSPDALRESVRVTLTLSGFFETGSITGNQAAWAALEAALLTDGLTLTYGSFAQTVKVLGLNQLADTMQRRLAYVITFMYVATARPNGIIKLSSQRRVTRITQRSVPHLVPFLDAARVQILGRGAQTIHATGYVICDSLAKARVAAEIELMNQFPTVNTPAELVGQYGATYAGVELPSSTITEFPEQMRVDWNCERLYGGAPDINGNPTWPLYGGLYGTGLS